MVMTANILYLNYWKTDGYSPNVRTMKRKHVEKYGTNVIVMSNQRQEVTVCLKNAGMKILTQTVVCETAWKERYHTGR